MCGMKCCNTKCHHYRADSVGLIERSNCVKNGFNSVSRCNRFKPEETKMEPIEQGRQLKKDIESAHEKIKDLEKEIEAEEQRFYAGDKARRFGRKCELILDYGKGVFYFVDGSTILHNDGVSEKIETNRHAMSGGYTKTSDHYITLSQLKAAGYEPYDQEKQERFTDNDDGTIKDNTTGLTWMKDAGAIGKQTWEDGMNRSDGWRLPTITELQSLIDYVNNDPALPAGHPFVRVQSSYYWAGTTCAIGTGGAWHVDMGNGGAYYGSKTYNCYVWPVRSDN